MMKGKKTAFGIIMGGLACLFTLDLFATSESAAKALFENRCSQCHGLNQATELDSYLPSYIQEMVSKMQHKPQSGISSEEAQEIYEYLVYQFAKTHRNKIDKELQALPEDKRKEEQAKIDQATAKF